MSHTKLSIKPNNHRIYQCPNEKKIKLLQQLIKKHADADIVVATANDAKIIIEALESSAVKVIEDKALIKDKELTCDIMIGFDMPIKDIVYIARASKAKEKSFMLLDESEQGELHFIEMLLGRAIKQESVEGFYYPVREKKETKFQDKKLSKDEIKEVAKKRYEKSTQEKPKFDDKKRSDKQKKEFKKEKSKKDEKFDNKKKTPKVKATGKVIKVKARKK